MALFEHWFRQVLSHSITFSRCRELSQPPILPPLNQRFGSGLVIIARGLVGSESHKKFQSGMGLYFVQVWVITSAAHPGPVLETW